MRAPLLVLCFLVFFGVVRVDASTPPSCLIHAARHDCGYQSQQSCQAAGCCWSPVSQLHHAFNHTQLQDTPWCFNPQQIVNGYYVSGVNVSVDGLTTVLLLELYDGNDYFGADIPVLSLEARFETIDRIRVRVIDPAGSRYEIPDSILPPAPINSSLELADVRYKFSYTMKPFGFAVTRIQDGMVIFNTTAPLIGNTPLFNGLIYSDQYLQLTTQMPESPSVYGLGEHVTSLQLPLDGNPITFFARDVASPVEENMYGSHPYYMELRENSQGETASHGVFLRNSNGLDIRIVDGQQALKMHQQHFPHIDIEPGTTSAGFLSYRVIGGIIDLSLFAGSTRSPEATIQQYHSVVGTPHMPPFWSLGFHQCRWGYPNLQAVQQVVQLYKQNNIPLDTMWTDIDYMDNYEDFSTDPVNFPTSELSSFISTLHSQGQHYMVILDPAIHNRTGYAPFEEGLEKNVFVQQANGNTFIGQVWPGYTAFPSFFASNTQSYWSDQISTFRAQVPVDGLWIDMNEASNFCSGDCDNPSTTLHKQAATIKHRHRSHHRFQPTLPLLHSKPLSFDPNNPPYRINNCGSGAPLNTKALDMDAVHSDSGQLEYDVHNLYGMSETIATKNALESTMGTRSLVISRSTFSGSGHHGGHWLGDNFSTFQSMAYSIAGILSMNMFGIPLVGADICGFNGNTNEELCARWMALGAFYPFSRNHNTKGAIPQEPYNWPSVQQVSILTLNARYSLIHYYNTLFYFANQNGGTVVRPLFFQFPTDQNTWSIDSQFLIGSAVMISPVLVQGVTSVTAYFPSAVWYDFWTYQVQGQAGYVSLQAPLSTIPVHIIGGNILFRQTPALNLALQMNSKNPFQLVVATDMYGMANGDLFIDNGLDLSVGSNALLTHAIYSNQQLQYSVKQNTYAAASALYFNCITILGVSKTPNTVTLNGQSVAFRFMQNSQILNVQNLQLPLNQPISLSWS